MIDGLRTMGLKAHGLKQAEQYLLQRTGTVIAVVALAVSGIFGGLETVPEPAVPTAAVKQSVDGGPWRITVTGARLINDMPTMTLREPGNHWVVVLVTVEITEKEGWGLLREFFDVPEVPGLVDKTATILMVRDASRPGRLQPGMPEELAYFWEQSAGSPLPTELTIKLPGWTKRESSLTRNVEWLPDLTDDFETAYRGTVTVPIVDKRVAPSPSPSPSVTP